MPINNGPSLPYTGVPDLTVNIVPPQNYLSPASTNIIGIVGTASWGPVNTPTIAGTTTQYTSLFGPIFARKYDLGTHLFTANAQQAGNFRCVRVTDGTDVAASGNGTASSATHFTVTTPGSGYTAAVVHDAAGVTIGNCVISGGGIASVTPTYAVSAGGALIVVPTGGGTGAVVTATYYGATWTGLYTGSLGNGVTVTQAVSSNSLGFKITVAGPGLLPEIFDNIVKSSGSASVWTDIVNAINVGQTIARGPSNIIRGSSSIGGGVPAVGVTTLAGGTDGVTTLTASVLVGSDTSPRTGMYALRGQQCSVALLSDADDNTQWANQVAFGLSEGVYMIGVGPAGDTIANAVTVKQGAGVYSYAFKLMFGDWVWWSDTQLGVTRLVSPQGFTAGQIVVIGPQNSTLNKPMKAVVATQKSGLNAALNATYARADLQTMFAAGIDVITNPQPGGNYFGCRAGINSAAPSAVGGDNYTGMTNFLATTLDSFVNGSAVGKIITMDLLRTIESQQNDFLAGLLQSGQLVRNPLTGAIPWSVVCDSTNNTPSSIASGNVYCNTQVVLGAILTNFQINLEDGQTVVLVTQPAQAA